MKWLSKLIHTEATPAPSGAGLSVVLSAVLDDDGALYRYLGGVPVVARTLMALDEIPSVREVIVVIREAELTRMADLCRTFEIQRVRKVVCAREAGLRALAVGVYECEPAAEFIGLHDPLRPFVTEEVLAGALNAAQLAGAGAPAVAVKDTIKIVQAGIVQETPDRSALRLLQTPQVVESSLLKAALVKAEEAGARATELWAVLECLGLPLQLTQGSDENIRVGTVTDLPAAETILARRAYKY